MSSTSATASATSSAASASASSTATIQVSGNLKIVGIILAIGSGVLIGSSFVFKKKGLLRSQAGQVAGEGVAYLKSPLWWLGMIMMILGELCNFGAYAFVEAIVVTPLGALSVVISAMLSSIFLKEKLTFFGWLGCGLSILGSVIIALNGPSETTPGKIDEFRSLFIAPGFLAWIGVLITASLIIAIYFGPRYGDKSMFWYILVCSMIGGISVSVTTGLGAAIVETAYGDNQFTHWFIYFLLVFVVVTLLTEVFYLNKALACYNTAMVTPTYYVIFTFFSMMSTIILYKGLSAPASQIITLVMGFLVICFGITILQMSKVDPEELGNKLDRRSTMLLQAARQQTETLDEKNPLGAEEPGIDALRGSFGTFGSIIRARSARRMSQSSYASGDGPRRGTSSGFKPGLPAHPRDNLAGMQRHQLFDNPVPRFDRRESDSISMQSQPSARKQTIKFDNEDIVHQYHRGAGPDGSAIHEHRPAAGAVSSPLSQIPSLPSLNESLGTVSMGTVSTNDSSRTTAGGNSAASMQSASTYSGLPPASYADAEAYGLRSAPVMGSSPPEQYTDPFAASPSTATIGSFDAEAQRIRGGGRHNRESSRHSGRSNRSYPRSHDKAEDAEESMRLFDQSQSQSDEEDVDHEGPPPGSVRLVQNRPPKGNYL
ncbi:unnamed protein product [Peniophora sp. CBMAI 1063]|nr:unnamed protein product [Peniophora sp. CBMAI 1063]